MTVVRRQWHLSGSNWKATAMCEVCGEHAHLPYILDMRAAVECKLAELASCQCCAEGTGHTLNKPTKWRPWVELPSHATQDEKVCKCNCHHDAQILCLMHPDCKALRSQVSEIRCIGERLCRENQLARIGRTLATDLARTSVCWSLEQNEAQ